MGVSISHSFCPPGSEGGNMTCTVYLVLLGLSTVLSVPEPSPSPTPNADPEAHLGALGYGGLGGYGYGGLYGGYGYTSPYYGGYGWGRKKRDADAQPSADPTADADANAEADAHWNAWGYGLNRWGGLFGGYGYASPYWRGYGGYWGRKKREADPAAEPAADADANADADGHWNAWGYGLNRWGGP